MRKAASHYLTERSKMEEEKKEVYSVYRYMKESMCLLFI
jgi:hypothetical protein